MKSFAGKYGVVLMAAASVAPVTHAIEGFQNTSATLSYTSKAGADPWIGGTTADGNEASLRLEHFGIYGYGDNYFRSTPSTATRSAAGPPVPSATTQETSTGWCGIRV